MSLRPPDYSWLTDRLPADTLARLIENSSAYPARSPRRLALLELRYLREEHIPGLARRISELQAELAIAEEKLAAARKKKRPTKKTPK